MSSIEDITSQCTNPNHWLNPETGMIECDECCGRAMDEVYEREDRERWAGRCQTFKMAEDPRPIGGIDRAVDPEGYWTNDGKIRCVCGHAARAHSGVGRTCMECIESRSGEKP